MRRKKIHINHNYEFELDLAPLLAVMVKLVPVLLVSSAFIQMMVIETDLPQVVQQAIKKQEEQPNKKQLQIEVSTAGGVKFILTANGQQKVEAVPVKEGHLDYPAVHQKFVELKKANPEIFKIELNPEANIAYKDVIKIMDEARRSREGLRFPVHDDKQNKDVETDYMFPEVVFGNTLEG
jgi:biopolymer transport protein ExbD